jgi:hypothetical protein
MHYDLSQFMHPIIKISALCISQGSFFNFYYESVAVFNFCGKSVGELSRSVFAKVELNLTETFAFSLRLKIYATASVVGKDIFPIIITTSMVYSGVKASEHLCIISSISTLINTLPYHYHIHQYMEPDHVCKQVSHLLDTELVHQISTVVGKDIFTIIITSSMVYSGVKASKHLCIIIIAKSFTVRRKIGTLPFFDLLQTFSTANAPAFVYLLALPTSRLKLSLQLIQFSTSTYSDKQS